MIYDFATEVTCTAPATDEGVAYGSDSYILFDDGGTAAGTAGPDGVPGLFGGEQVYMQLEVTTAFVVDTGTPMACFGVAIDNSVAMTASAMVLAMTGGSIVNDGEDDHVGLDAAQLTLGRTFCLALPPWEDIMQLDVLLWPDANTAATLAAHRLFRYMGLIIQNPMPVAAGAHFFSAGAIVGRLTHTPASTAVTSNIYPSNMTVA